MVAEHTLPRISKMTGKLKGDVPQGSTWGASSLVCDEDAVALEEQLNLSRGVWGARVGL